MVPRARYYSGGAGQSDKVAELIARFDNMRPADIASLLRAMPAAERQTVAEQLDDERLADILQELPDDRQAELIEALAIERAAVVLEEMDPDDAADLLGELPETKPTCCWNSWIQKNQHPCERLMGLLPRHGGRAHDSRAADFSPRKRQWLRP